MTVEINTLFSDNDKQRFALHEHYLNAQMVRVLQTIGFDVSFKKGQGQYLYDSENNRYLDLLSGFGVFALGRNHPDIRKALIDVLEADFPNLVQLDVSVLAGVLAEHLVSYVPYLQKVFFANSGAEAVEAAMKFARMATQRTGIVFCQHGYHGLTYGALSLMGGPQFREGFGPFLPDCFDVPFNDLDALEAILKAQTIAAFIVEPIQGKGVNLPDAHYLKEAHQICQKYGTLFIADEIQTGLGRTGKFLAIEHWHVKPDMVLLAKALSGGHVPIGAVLMRKVIFDKIFSRMDRAVVHGSTFAKNDLAMAAGIATLDVLEKENLIEKAQKHGDYLKLKLEALKMKHDMLKSVRVKGLMIGIELHRPRAFWLKIVWDLIEASNKGLFSQLITIPLFKKHRMLSQVAGHASHTIKFLPPLVITREDCDDLIFAIDNVLTDSHRPLIALKYWLKLVTKAIVGTKKSIKRIENKKVALLNNN